MTTHDRTPTTLSHSPARARSDVAPAGPHDRPRRRFLVHGLVLSAGAAGWAASILAFGLNPEGTGALAVQGVVGVVFQAGLLALLRVLWLTRGLGEGRLARAVLRLQSVLVLLAMGSTVADATRVADIGQPWWAALDACWPLSMLGMFLIGIRVAVAGRWTGVRRWWPLLAESWAVVVIPALGVFGQEVGRAVAAAHLLLGYAVLGILVSRGTDDSRGAPGS